MSVTTATAAEASAAGTGVGGLAAMDAERLAEMAMAIAEGRTDLAAVAGMTPDEIEAVYTVGHNLYVNGQYEEAVDIFRFLCMHRHMEARFWFGLGAACQMRRDYQGAVAAYRTCAMLDIEDAEVPLRAAQCFAALGEPAEMRQALEGVVILAEQFPGKNDPHAARAKLMLAAMPAGAAS